MNSVFPRPFALLCGPAKAFSTALAASVAVAIVPSVARAQNITFAVFTQQSPTQQDPTQKLFSKSGDLFSGSNVPIFFRFSVDNACGPKNTFISGVLNFSATFTGPITSGAGNSAVQVPDNITARFTSVDSNTAVAVQNIPVRLQMDLPGGLSPSEDVARGSCISRKAH